MLNSIFDNLLVVIYYLFIIWFIVYIYYFGYFFDDLRKRLLMNYRGWRMLNSRIFVILCGY